MPYVPQPNGETIWVDDIYEADKLYEELWGQDAPEKTQEDFKGVSTLPEKEEQKAGIFEPVRIAAHGVTAIPGDITGLGQKIGLWGMQPGNIGWGLATRNKDEGEKMLLRQQVHDETEALSKLGVRADGSAYGLPASWGIWSDNSDIRKDWLEPRTGWGKFGSNIVSIFTSAYLTRGGGYSKTKAILKPTTKPGLAYRAADALKLPKTSTGIRLKARGAVIFTLKDLVPNAVEDLVHFQPQPNKEVAGALAAIAELPQEDRRLAVQALLAETDTEFDYTMETIKEVAGGAISVTLLRGIFGTARHFLKRARREVPTVKKDGTPVEPEVRAEAANKIIDEELNKELPNLAEEVDKIEINKAEQSNNDAIGKLTTNLRNQTDKLARETSLGAHAVSESFLNKSQGSPLLGDMKLIDEIEESLNSRPKSLTYIDGRISELQAALQKGLGKGEVSLEELPILRRLIDSEIDSMTKKSEAQPIQYVMGKRGKPTKKRIPKSGWLSNTANSRRFNSFNRLSKELTELEQLTERRGKYLENRTADEVRRDDVYKDLLEFYGVGEAGFRKFVNTIRKELNALDKTNLERINAVNDQNSLLVSLGRQNETTPLDLQNDPFYDSFHRLRELIEEAESKDSFDVDFIEEFVRRADEIHNGTIKAGGVMPTTGLASKTIDEIRKAEGAASGPRLTVKSIDPAAEGFDEIEKALEEGVDESIENVARAVSEKYNVPFEEALENIKAGKDGFGDYIAKLTERSDLPEDLRSGPFDPEDIIKPKESPLTNPVPITKDGKVNSDAVAVNRASKTIPGITNVKTPVIEATRNLNKDNNFLQKVETDEDVRKLGTDIADQVEQMQKLAAQGELNENAFAKFDWFNTSTLKYVADLDQSAVAKFAVDELGKRGFKISRHALMASISMLKKAAEAPELIDDILGEGVEYAESVKAGLPFIIVTTSMIENNSKALLKTSRMLQDVRLGKDPGGGYTQKEALENFKSSYLRMMANINVVSNLFEGFGNGLRLMRKNNRIAFEEGRPDIVAKSFAEITKKWDDIDSFTKELADVTKTANEEVKEVFDTFVKKVESGDEITQAEWDGIDNLVARVHDSQGDLTKLKELEVTGPMLLRRVQSGGMISSPMTVSSIPPQAMGELAIRQTGMTFSSWQNLAMERWIRKNTGDTYVEALQNARFHTRIWKNIAYGLQESWEPLLARWQYGRSISDPGSFNKAMEIGSAGIKRDQQILDEKRALQIKIPFTDVVLNKSDFERQEIFNALNELRISMKVFHDYFIAGEAWDKRGWAAKWLAAPTVSAARQIPGLKNLGTKSYYAGGEMVNMTAPFQFTALADEFLTAAYSNAAIKTKIELDVDEKIVAGLLDETQRLDEIKKLLSKSNEDFYRPVTAGLEDEVIGHQIVDKQLGNVLEIAREVNRTSELTGIFGAAGDWINYGRYHEGKGYSPALQMFANTMAGVVTSPLNSIKWGIRYGLGTDIWQASTDVVRLGIGKALADESLIEALPKELQKRITQNSEFVEGLKSFESKYFSSDINVRTKAQGALAVAVGMHSLAFIHMNDPNLEITGGLENTYQSEKGQVGLYTMKVDMPWGSFRVPYRWIPVYGSVLAMQATMRDIDEFGIQQGAGGFDLFGVIAAATANYIMETPGAASFDRMFKAIEKAGRQDSSGIVDIFSRSIAGAGEPYYQFRKFVAEGFDPRKPSNLMGKYDQEFILNNPEAVDNPIWKAFKGIGSTFGSAYAHSAEYNVFGFLADEVVNIIQGHPEGRNRRALWYGKPGETINVRNAGKWNGLRAVFGRHMAYPNDLNSVSSEIINNLIQGPGKDFLSGREYGIKGVSKRVVNDFEHFLNEEFTYYDANTGKTYVGIHSAIKDLVESKYYLNLEGLDSPYATSGYQILPGIKPFSPTPPNWDTKNNERRTILQGYIRTMISKAREDFVMGTYPDQQYKASEELKQAVLKTRRALLGGIN